MNTCVIGGGAAGMMAAIWAAKSGQIVTLFEKNEKLGKKLFLTGKGRCNLTNSCDVEELFQNVVTNSKFMYSSFYGFNNSDVIEFFENAGLKTKVERGNRVFPESDHSSDVIKALSNTLKSLGVKIELNSEITSVVVENDNGDIPVITGVVVKNTSEKSHNTHYFDRVIMACGGLSYPSTGSDGSMLKMLSDFGIKISPVRPALIPLCTNDEWITKMQGLSLKNVNFYLEISNKVKYSQMGEMLFTHFGISGPIVLSASSYLKACDFVKEDLGLGEICKLKDNIWGYIDMKPALSNDVLDERILRDFSKNENKDIVNVLTLLIPAKMTESVCVKAGIDPHKKIHDITKNERASLVKCLKRFPIKIDALRPIDEAIITSGGVSVKEINPSTMECKRIKNLYFAGEMIDVDALTGGFNLQIAWSTGYVAGMCE